MGHGSLDGICLWVPISTCQREKIKAHERIMEQMQSSASTLQASPAKKKRRLDGKQSEPKDGFNPDPAGVQGICRRQVDLLPTPVLAVKKSSQNDCYVLVPNPLLDPVVKDNMVRLEKFYSQTFWANHSVFLLCCQAALAIAKRILNVDPNV